MTCYDCTDIHFGVGDAAGGAAYDCIALRAHCHVTARQCAATTRLFRTGLETSRLHGGTFTMPVLALLRRFAKRRHVYGSKYGFPGGSAWSSMLWVRVGAGARHPFGIAFCQWLDSRCGLGGWVGTKKKQNPTDVSPPTPASRPTADT